MAFSSEFMAYFYLLANKKAHKKLYLIKQSLNFEQFFTCTLGYILEKDLISKARINVKLLGKKGI